MKNRTAWIGSTPSSEKYVSIPELIIKENYHRVNPKHHGSFDEVIFIENNLSDFFTWPLIIDELIRLLDCIGKVTLKIRISSPFFSIVSLNNKLYGLSEGNLDLESFIYENDYILMTFMFNRKEIYLDNNWTFGIIWDGKNKIFLEKYINSIHNQTMKTKYEILICGPNVNLNNNLNCHFIETNNDIERYSNISKKKNLIVSKSLFDNICIVHNRYELNNDFIESFNSFGLDFDIVVVKQKLLDGRRVPDWIAQSSNYVFTKNYLLNYDDYSPYQYVGGGIIVSKRSVLLKHRWNELSVWNTGEDLELSKRLRDNGIEPRFNSYTAVNVLSLREGILEDFTRLSTKELLNADYNIYKITNKQNNILSYLNILKFFCFKVIKRFIGNQKIKKEK